MQDNDETKQTLEGILSALKASESTLKAVVQDKNVTASKLTTLEVKLEIIEQDMKSLLHIVRGNGSDGLQTRMKLIEDHVISLEKESSRRKAIEVAESKGKWVLWAAVISGLAGLVTSIANVLLS